MNEARIRAIDTRVQPELTVGQRWSTVLRWVRDRYNVRPETIWVNPGEVEAYALLAHRMGIDLLVDGRIARGTFWYEKPIDPTQTVERPDDV